MVVLIPRERRDAKVPRVLEAVEVLDGLLKTVPGQEVGGRSGGVRRRSRDRGRVETRVHRGTKAEKTVSIRQRKELDTIYEEAFR